jgi:hypothetical protein
MRRHLFEATTRIKPVGADWSAGWALGWTPSVLTCLLALVWTTGVDSSGALVARMRGVARTLRAAAQRHDAVRARYDALPQGASHKAVVARMRA